MIGPGPPKHRCVFVFRVCDGFLTSTRGSFHLPLKWECTLMHFEKHSCGNTHRSKKFKFMSVPMTTTNRKKSRNFRQCWPTNLQQILGREKASFTLALQYKIFFLGDRIDSIWFFLAIPGRLQSAGSKRVKTVHFQGKTRVTLGPPLSHIFLTQFHTIPDHSPGR